MQATEKFSPGATSSHFASPSTAEEVFLTTYPFYSDPVNVQVLALSILGGFCNALPSGSPTPLMYPPWTHPSNPNLFATSLDVKPAYIDNTNTPGSGSLFPYRVAACRVGFQSLPYYADADVPDDWPLANFNFLEFRPTDCNQTFTSPVGLYKFTSGTDSGKQATLGYPLTSGLTYYDVIVHRVPDTPLLSIGTGSTPADFCGTINSDDPFADGSDVINKLLLQSIDLGDGAFGDWQGNNIVNIHLHFIYNPNGWNTALDSTGTWEPVVATNGSGVPFTPYPFVTLMNLLLPPQV